MRTQNITNELIIDLLGEGDTAKEIASKAGVRVRCVEKRIERMKKKLSAKTVTQLVCIMKGLVSVPGNG